MKMISALFRRSASRRPVTTFPPFFPTNPSLSPFPSHSPLSAFPSHKCSLSLLLPPPKTNNDDDLAFFRRSVRIRPVTTFPPFFPAIPSLSPFPSHSTLLSFPIFSQKCSLSLLPPPPETKNDDDTSIVVPDTQIPASNGAEATPDVIKATTRQQDTSAGHVSSCASGDGSGRTTEIPLPPPASNGVGSTRQQDTPPRHVSSSKSGDALGDVPKKGKGLIAWVVTKTDWLISDWGHKLANALGILVGLQWLYTNATQLLMWLFTVWVEREEPTDTPIIPKEEPAEPESEETAAEDLSSALKLIVEESSEAQKRTAKELERINSRLDKMEGKSDADYSGWK